MWLKRGFVLLSKTKERKDEALQGGHDRTGKTHAISIFIRHFTPIPHFFRLITYIPHFFCSVTTVPHFFLFLEMWYRSNKANKIIVY